MARWVAGWMDRWVGVFLHVENLFFFSSKETNSYSFTFNVSSLSVRKMLLKLRVAKRTLFPNA